MDDPCFGQNNLADKSNTSLSGDIRSFYVYIYRKEIMRTIELVGFATIPKRRPS